MVALRWSLGLLSEGIREGGREGMTEGGRGQGKER